MSTDNPKHDSKTPADARSAGRKPYEKPAFRVERVFEVMALSCGKIDTTQAQCGFNSSAS